MSKSSCDGDPPWWLGCAIAGLLVGAMGIGLFCAGPTMLKNLGHAWLEWKELLGA